MAWSATWLSKALISQRPGPAWCEVMAVTSQTGPRGGGRWGETLQFSWRSPSAASPAPGPGSAGVWVGAALAPLGAPPGASASEPASLVGPCAGCRTLRPLGRAQHSWRAPGKQKRRVGGGFCSRLIQQLLQAVFLLFESSLLQRRRETKHSLVLVEAERCLCVRQRVFSQPC